MANKTWNSMANTGAPSNDQFSSDRMRTRPMADATAPGRGRVGNRLGETTASLTAEFTPQQLKRTAQGEAYTSRSRFHEPSTTNKPACQHEQPGLLKTRWYDTFNHA